MYTRLEGGALKSIVLLYVDDLLVGFGSESELKRFERVIQEYRTIDMKFLSPSTHLVFIGIDLRMTSDGLIWLSQQTFVSRLKGADPTEILKDEKSRAPVEKLKTFY